MLKKNCYYCKQPSDLYIKSSNKKNDNNFNFASTEINTEESEIKPDLFFCKNCEIIFSEFCDVKFENNYIDVLDQLYIDQIDNKKKYFRNIIKKISNMINEDDDVMEIGSYYGAFGSEIKNSVNSYTGLELSKHASNYSKKKFNLNTVNKNIYEYFKNDDKKFDIIFMFDVLEHLDDPDAILNLCSKNLKKNGRLILSTMNMDSIFAKLTGKYYPWIIPMHKFYFSDNSVKKYLNKNDLFLEKIIGDVRIISLEYLFLKISQKISIFKNFYKLLIKFESIKNIPIKFSLFDINIYCAYKK